jgi:hypothetical protein
MQMKEQTLKSIAEARDIMESFDQTAAMTIGFDKPTYELTAEQMTKIAGALYLADCLIYEFDKEDKYEN